MAAQSAGYLSGALLLAAPFAVLLGGHMCVAGSWRRDAFLLAGNILFGLLWSLASVAMVLFQPGSTGSGIFSAALVTMALLYVSLCRLVPENASARRVPG